ncbi:MAG: primosomal protein N' [SAR86 cluster bacterium]|nr:primosomal protein N' [SAR86 cluster bacterium]
MNNQIIEIILPVPIQGTFSYLVPNSLTKAELKVGCRVLVPFGTRKLVGIILKHSNIIKDKSINYKSITSLLDDNPLIDKKLLLLADWASRYYHHPIGDVLSYFMTPSLRKGEEASFAYSDSWHITTEGDFILPESLKSSPKQKEAIRIFKDTKNLNRVAAKAYGITSSTIKSLEDKDLIKKSKIEVIPQFENLETAFQRRTLNSEQSKAVEELKRGKKDSTYLLYGVTGSGKTEVYIEAISDVIDQGKQALVLIPEIGLTPQTEERFKKNFGSRVVSMHSAKNDRERLDAWLCAKRGMVDVVIGTRSSVFTPFKDLGIIVVDEEHDLSYKQTDRFRYSARDIAIYRSKLLKIPLILASATPSLESLKNAEDDKYTLLKLNKRASGVEMPIFKSLDIRGERLTNGFSENLLEEITSELQNNNQVLIFINRRGFAPSLVCEACGWIATCKSCDASMIIHTKPLRMRCHHCSADQKPLEICGNCRDPNLNYLGVGTQKAEQFLEERFSKYPVIRIDRDSTRTKKSMDNYLNEIMTGKPLILVGTQILAKGHHFPNVTLVGILDSDSGLFSADFRGSERVAQLITQVSGRAGRANKKGKVLLQTYCPDHPQIEELTSGNYENFSKKILIERMQSSMPPYTYQARFQAESSQGEFAMRFLDDLKQEISEGKLRIVGPIPSIMERKAGVYRWELSLYAESRLILHRKLKEMVNFLYNKKRISNVRWSLDVDPLGVW